MDVKSTKSSDHHGHSVQKFSQQRFSPLIAASPLPQSSSFSTTMSRSEVTPGPQAPHFAAKKRTMLPPDSFKDKVVFVTGGGTGLGKGMSTKFSELGAKVVIVAR